MLDLDFDASGWLVGIPDENRMLMQPRPRMDDVKRKFVPAKKGLPLMRKLYGQAVPRALTVHGTDVVPRSVRAMARRKALSARRMAGYHFLLGGGEIFQLWSILGRTYHAGRKRSKFVAHLNNPRTRRQVLTVMDTDGKWTAPVVDGHVVRNPNDWGPGIEIVSWQRLDLLNDCRVAVMRIHPKTKKRVVFRIVPPDEYTVITIGDEDQVWHNFDPRDLDNLGALLRALYENTNVTPDTVWRHSDLAPISRIDPGPLCDVAQIAQAAALDPESIKEDDDENEGDDLYEEPAEGSARRD